MNNYLWLEPRGLNIRKSLESIDLKIVIDVGWVEGRLRSISNGKTQQQSLSYQEKG